VPLFARKKSAREKEQTLDPAIVVFYEAFELAIAADEIP
jgi:hypothetical protein